MEDAQSRQITDQPTPPDAKVPAGSWPTLILGVYLIIFGGLLFWAILDQWIWPVAADSTTLSGVDVEKKLMVLVMLSGAIGSLVHVATSFSDYVGMKQFYTSWIWWYMLRPVVGAGLVCCSIS